MMPDASEKPVKIVLKTTYDAASRVRLQIALNAERSAAIAENAGSLSVEAFFDKIVDELRDYQDDVLFYDPATGRLYEPADMTSRTLSNFLKADAIALRKTHPPILRLAEAYLYVSSQSYRDGVFGHSFLARLGAHTALQYRAPAKPSALSRLEAFHGAFVSDTEDVFIPGATQTSAVAIGFRAIPHRNYVLCQVLPFPRGIDWFKLSSAHKAEWEAEVFVGIGVRTVEGLTCHLRSLGAFIPLYAFVRASDKTPSLEAAFATHQSAGFIQEYQSFLRADQPQIVRFFDEFPWMI